MEAGSATAVGNVGVQVGWAAGAARTRVWRCAAAPRVAPLVRATATCVDAVRAFLDRPTAMAASGSSLSTLEDVFEEMTSKMRPTCCPFSSNGLEWLKTNREAYDIVDRECGDVPKKMPKCCSSKTFNHGSNGESWEQRRIKNLLAMKDHASKNMSGYVDPEDSDAEEELEPEHRMHLALHKWIETAAVSKEDQLNQMKRQLAGQNGQHKAKERKLTDNLQDVRAQNQQLLQQGEARESENASLKAQVRAYSEQLNAFEDAALKHRREEAILRAGLNELWEVQADQKKRDHDEKTRLYIERQQMHEKMTVILRAREQEKEKFAAFLRQKQAEMQAKIQRQLDMVADASREEARENEQNMQQMQDMLRRGDERVEQDQREIDELKAKLKEVKEDLEDSQELVEQQSLFTDTWQGKFEELKELAKSNGTPLAAILEIQDRKVGAK